MSDKIPYTITSASISFVYKGETHLIQKEALNFRPLCDALLNEDLVALEKNLTVARGVETWAKGDFKFVGGKLSYKGADIPEALNKRIIATASENGDPTYLFKFWERLQHNPSFRSVNQLFSFLEHKGIPIDKDGFVLAYKAVREDHKDFHSGKCDNTPGNTLEMPRNQISDDQDLDCHVGFHVGALAYANSFGDSNRRVLICRIDPANVVSVPKDASCQKMRVCKYDVIGYYGVTLPSTNATPADLDEEEDIEDLLDEKIDITAPGPLARKKKEREGLPNFSQMGEKELLECSHIELREYAKQLSIVGASKIKGGKAAIVLRILEVRR